jgi:hypothetical protein
MRSASTFLTDVQLRAAEDAFRRVEGRTSPLLVYLDYALANYREHDQQKPLKEAMVEYYATKKTAFERTLLSCRQLRSIENELAALKAYFPIWVNRMGRKTVCCINQGNPLPGRARGLKESG